MMNILYIAYSCNPYAGSEDKIGWNVPFESSKTNNVYLITKEEQQVPIENYLNEHPIDNMHVYYVDIPRIYKRFFRGFFYSGRLNIWHKRVYAIAKKICEDNSIDVIHQITPIEFRAVGDYGKIENVKYVCGPLGGGESIPKGLKEYARGHSIVELTRAVINRWYKYRLKTSGIMNRCDYVMFANNETKDFISDIGLLCPSELISEIGLRQDELISNTGKRGCIFLVAGRLIYRKGHEFLLDALERVPDNLDYKVRVVGDGPELKKLRERCANNANLSKHVHFTGEIPYLEIEKEYYNANALILPSIRETTGTVLLEAMSKGIPVITINMFGGSMLLDENSGWLYSGNCKESYIENLKNAIMECIANPEKMTIRGMRAREKAEYYTWHVKNKKYQKIYEDLLNLSLKI